MQWEFPADGIEMGDHHLTCRRKRGGRGFTAIEALVAATILAILTAAVSGAL